MITRKEIVACVKDVMKTNPKNARAFVNIVADRHPAVADATLKELVNELKIADILDVIEWAGRDQ